jgi:hypothetical protein
LEKISIIFLEIIKKEDIYEKEFQEKNSKTI